MSSDRNEGKGLMWFFIAFFAIIMVATSNGCTSHEGTPIEDSKQPVIPERSK